MTDIGRTMLSAVLVWAAGAVIYLYLLRIRFFARFGRGYTISLFVAFVGCTLAVASVIAAWGYQSAKGILERELTNELQDVGAIIEHQIAVDVRRIEERLAALSSALAGDLMSHAPAATIAERLRSVQQFNNRYLQLRLYDDDGKVVTETSTTGEFEPVNRIATSFNLEGKPFVSDPYVSKAFRRQVLYVSVPVRRGAGPVLGAVSARFDLQSELAELATGSRFDQSGYAVIVDGNGHVIAHPDAARLDSDLSSYVAVQEAQRTRATGSLVATNAQGVRRLFVYRALQNPATLATKPWVLLTEIDRDDEMAPLRAFRRELVFGVGAMLLVSLIVAYQFATSIRRPLYDIRDFAQRVRAGDLSAQVAVGGRDVTAQLGAALNDMVAGLRERDHVKNVFGRYIATQVSDQILRGEVDLGGEARTVTILFSDIRDFSGMSEKMTPQQVVSFLNDYFSEMVEAVFEQGGVLDKFIGDGLMAVFGSVGVQPDHPRRAVLAALRMRALLAKLNGLRAIKGQPPIAIGIGIHTDEVIVGNIGSRKRLEYTVVGDGVNTSSRVQALNKEFGTTILITESTYAAVKREFNCRPMPEAQLRGKTRPIRFYEVVSVAAEAAV